MSTCFGAIWFGILFLAHLALANKGGLPLISYENVKNGSSMGSMFFRLMDTEDTHRGMTTELYENTTVDHQTLLQLRELFYLKELTLLPGRSNFVRAYDFQLGDTNITYSGNHLEYILQNFGRTKVVWTDEAARKIENTLGLSMYYNIMELWTRGFYFHGNLKDCFLVGANRLSPHDKNYRIFEYKLVASPILSPKCLSPSNRVEIDGITYFRIYRMTTTLQLLQLASQGWLTNNKDIQNSIDTFMSIQRLVDPDENYLHTIERLIYAPRRIAESIAGTSLVSYYELMHEASLPYRQNGDFIYQEMTALEKQFLANDGSTSMDAGTLKYINNVDHSCGLFHKDFLNRHTVQLVIKLDTKADGSTNQSKYFGYFNCLNTILNSGYAITDNSLSHESSEYRIGYVNILASKVQNFKEVARRTDVKKLISIATKSFLSNFGSVDFNEDFSNNRNLARSIFGSSLLVDVLFAGNASDIRLRDLIHVTNYDTSCKQVFDANMRIDQLSYDICLYLSSKDDDESTGKILVLHLPQTYVPSDSLKSVAHSMVDANGGSLYFVPLDLEYEAKFNPFDVSPRLMIQMINAYYFIYKALGDEFIIFPERRMGNVAFKGVLAKDSQFTRKRLESFGLSSELFNQEVTKMKNSNHASFIMHLMSAFAPQQSIFGTLNTSPAMKILEELGIDENAFDPELWNPHDTAINPAIQKIQAYMDTMESKFHLFKNSYIPYKKDNAFFKKWDNDAVKIRWKLDDVSFENYVSESLEIDRMFLDMDNAEYYNSRTIIDGNGTFIEMYTISINKNIICRNPQFDGNIVEGITKYFRMKKVALMHGFTFSTTGPYYILFSPLGEGETRGMAKQIFADALFMVSKGKIPMKRLLTYIDAFEFLPEDITLDDLLSAMYNIDAVSNQVSFELSPLATKLRNILDSFSDQMLSPRNAWNKIFGKPAFVNFEFDDSLDFNTLVSMAEILKSIKDENEYDIDIKFRADGFGFKIFRKSEFKDPPSFGLDDKVKRLPEISETPPSFTTFTHDIHLLLRIVKHFDSLLIELSVDHTSKGILTISGTSIDLSFYRRQLHMAPTDFTKDDRLETVIFDILSKLTFKDTVLSSVNWRVEQLTELASHYGFTKRPPSFTVIYSTLERFIPMAKISSDPLDIIMNEPVLRLMFGWISTSRQILMYSIKGEDESTFVDNHCSGLLVVPEISDLPRAMDALFNTEYFRKEPDNPEEHRFLVNVPMKTVDGYLAFPTCRFLANSKENLNVVVDSLGEPEMEGIEYDSAQRNDHSQHTDGVAINRFTISPDFQTIRRQYYRDTPESDLHERDVYKRDTYVTVTFEEEDLDGLNFYSIEARQNSMNVFLRALLLYCNTFTSMLKDGFITNLVVSRKKSFMEFRYVPPTANLTLELEKDLPSMTKNWDRYKDWRHHVTLDSFFGSSQREFLKKYSSRGRVSRSKDALSPRLTPTIITKKELADKRTSRAAGMLMFKKILVASLADALSSDYLDLNGIPMLNKLVPGLGKDPEARKKFMKMSPKLITKVMEYVVKMEENDPINHSDIPNTSGDDPELYLGDEHTKSEIAKSALWIARVLYKEIMEGENMRCMICKDGITNRSLRESTILSCGHMLTEDCHTSLVSYNTDACPLCRVPMNL